MASASSLIFSCFLILFMFGALINNSNNKTKNALTLNLCIFFTHNPSEVLSVSKNLDIVMLFPMYDCSLIIIPHVYVQAIHPFYDVGSKLLRKFGKYVYTPISRAQCSRKLGRYQHCRENLISRITHNYFLCSNSCTSSRNVVSAQTCGLRHMASIPFSSCRYK